MIINYKLSIAELKILFEILLLVLLKFAEKSEKRILIFCIVGN